MKNFKGTSGNWRVVNDTWIVSDAEHSYKSNNNEESVDAYGGRLICESILDKDDASLIAAAPELLEALQNAKTLIGNFRIKVEVPTQEVWEQMEKAITKALGE